MNETDIRKYAGLMAELGLTGLEFTEDGKTVRLERTAAVQPVQTVLPVSAVTGPAPEAPAQPAAEAQGTAVTSPIVGVFYAAPAENEAPFVTVGSRVSKGDTLCIIEAMKLMNEITAEADGVVTEVCVSNGQTVDYGTVLFRIGR